MAESIFLRVRRLLSARVEDSVDAMERANSDGVMREAIREVDRAIDEVRADREQAMTRRLQAARQQGMLTKKVEELTGKARFALGQGRDDLAEGALARQVDLEQQAERLDAVQANAREEEARLEESLTALRTRKHEMEEALAAFAIAHAEASLGGDGGLQNQRDVERKVERAEAAFDRAMTGAGGAGFARSDVAAINKVAELDTLQKTATVAERLAALKQEAKAA
jgi:phage shock protein A